MKPTIVMQTDFSYETSSVCTMYGVCEIVDPELRVVNNTHSIPNFNIFAASYALDYIVQYWPLGTIFISVVDPGVGTDRRACVAKLKNGSYIVTPDNGTLTYVAEHIGIEEIRQIDETSNRYPTTKACNIFHGRDLFAYCAARLASGTITYEGVGPAYPVQDVVLIKDVKPQILKEGSVLGMIESANGHFGLVHSNIHNEFFHSAGFQLNDMIHVMITHNDEVIYSENVRYAKAFGYVGKGEPVITVGDTLTMQIALNLENFVHQYQIGIGPDWLITFSKS